MEKMNKRVILIMMLTMINFLIFFILIASFFLVDFDVYWMLLRRYELRSLEEHFKKLQIRNSPSNNKEFFRCFLTS